MVLICISLLISDAERLLMCFFKYFPICIPHKTHLLFQNCYCGKLRKTYNLPHEPFLSVHFRGIKYILLAGQPSPPSITTIHLQNSSAYKTETLLCNTHTSTPYKWHRAVLFQIPITAHKASNFSCPPQQLLFSVLFCFALQQLA